MPELPEVETTLRGIEPFIVEKPVKKVIVRQSRLRWPVPKRLSRDLTGCFIEKIERRAKYLLLYSQKGTAIVHLGMSGCLRALDVATPPQKHDHIDLLFADDSCLRFTDPRRFGAWLWTIEPPLNHKLLVNLGVEPLIKDFNAQYLIDKSKNRSQTIKQCIMDSKIMVGVGNIYAQEALFIAGIKPTLAANKLSRPRAEKLVSAIKLVLRKAINKGGTTLRDFRSADNKPGYFYLELQVYGRGGQECVKCAKLLKETKIGGRSTVYCPICQKR